MGTRGSSRNRRRGNRVTTTSPWILGGDGELRDLFPIPPALLILGRLLTNILRQWRTTLPIIIYILLAILWKSLWLPLLIAIPMLILGTAAFILYYWYNNPDIPLIKRKPIT